MPKIDLNLDKLKAEYAEIQAFLSQPSAYSAPDFSAKNKRFSELEKIIGKEKMDEHKKIRQQRLDRMNENRRERPDMGRRGNRDQ